MSEFMSLYNMVKKPCFKNAENRSRADFILTNYPRRFHTRSVFKTGLSFSQVYKHSYRNFWNDEFRADLDNIILKHDINNIELQNFHKIFTVTLNKRSPMKIKIRPRKVFDKRFT